MNDSPQSSSHKLPLLLAAVALGLLSAAGLCALGQGGSQFWPGRLAFVIESILLAGALACGYLLAALGFGRLFRRALANARHPWLLQFALGMALLLTLSHLLGALGALAGPWIARGVLALGVVLLAHQLLRSEVNLRSLASATSPWLLLATPATALLLVAASSLPGWLWVSEAHGYDVLSYHLQLPAEWLGTGRLQGLEHNVYSFLPSFIEAAYLHLASAVGSLHAGEGAIILSTQFLHAGMAILAAVTLSRLPAVWLGAIEERRSEAGKSHGAGRAASTRRLGAQFLPLTGPLSAALLAVPWVIVVGSLSYNEMALVLLFAAAAMALAEANLTVRSRCLMAAFIMGVACGAKLTAVFLAVLPLALVAPFLLSRAALRRSFLPALGVFLLPLVPYFARNIIDAGNPLFPFATGLFGAGHWSAEQVARWNEGHRFVGSLTDWLSAVWSRGFAHPQWSLFFALVLVAAVVALVRRCTRPAALAALVILSVQLIGWSLLTHIQARFLLPTLVPAAILLGLSIYSLPEPRLPAARRLALGALCAPALLLTAHACWIFANQRAGEPSYMLDRLAYAELTGRLHADRPELLESSVPPPQYFVNHALPADSLVYLVGGATPLYFLPPVLYHTTWDSSPLGLLIREFGDDYSAIAAELRKRGVTHMLIDFSELRRLERDGWYDPLVTPQVARDFALAHGELLYDWDFLRLVRLRE